VDAKNDISLTLEERGKRYGSFHNQATISQCIKSVMRQGNWEKLDDDQRECLEIVAHKIARILNGDPNYHDSWHDIVGYAKLVADRLASKVVVCPNFPVVTEVIQPATVDLSSLRASGSAQVVCGEVKRDPISGKAIFK
jgi:hypothetical protein